MKDTRKYRESYTHDEVYRLLEDFLIEYEKTDKVPFNKDLIIATGLSDGDIRGWCNRHPDIKGMYERLQDLRQAKFDDLMFENKKDRNMSDNRLLWYSKYALRNIDAAVELKNDTDREAIEKGIIKIGFKEED